MQILPSWSAKALFLLPVAGALLLGGCKTLKNVNDFSNAAHGHLQNIEKLKTSFTGEYTDLAMFERYDIFSENIVALASDTPAVIDRFQTLALARGTDSGANKIFESLDGYFSGLAKLAADSVVEYSLDSLTTPLGSGAILDTSKIKLSTIATASTIATKLTTFITSEYRIRHIKKYVVEAAPLVDRLARDLIDVLNSLDIKLDQRRQRLTNKVYQPLLARCRTALERRQVIAEYEKAMAGIVSEREQIGVYIQGLKVIAIGHYYLYLHVDELSKKEVKDRLTNLTSRLKDLCSQFTTIQNQK